MKASVAAEQFRAWGIRSTFGFIQALPVVAALVTTPSASAQLYWTGNLNEPVTRQIGTAQLTGADARVLIDLPSTNGATGIAVSGSQLFWINEFEDAIYAADLDGGGDIRRLIALGETFGAGDYGPRGIAATPSSIYWTDFSNDAIYVAGHDGSGARVLIDLQAVLGGAVPGDYDPIGIAVAGPRLYWTDGSNDSRVGYSGIYTAELDGSNPTELVNLNAEFGEDRPYNPVEISVSGSRIFWVDQGINLQDGVKGIYASDLDGRNATRLLFLQESGLWGLAASGSRIYWCSQRDEAIYTAGIDGSDPRKLFNTFGVMPYGLTAVGSSVFVEPPFQITDIEPISQTAFTRTWRVRWNSKLTASYRVSVSDDLANWSPARPDPWPSAGLQTEAEVILPSSLKAAYFRVEEE